MPTEHPQDHSTQGSPPAPPSDEHIQEMLQSMPRLQAPPMAWNRVQGPLDAAPASPKRPLPMAAAIAALGFLLIFSLSGIEQSVNPRQNISLAPTTLTPVPLVTGDATAELASLIARSQQLESRRPSLVTHSDDALRLTRDALVMRIADLDRSLVARLEDGQTDIRDAAVPRQLWRQRLQLMESLRQVESQARQDGLLRTAL